MFDSSLLNLPAEVHIGPIFNTPGVNKTGNRLLERLRIRTCDLELIFKASPQSDDVNNFFLNLGSSINIGFNF